MNKLNRFTSQSSRSAGVLALLSVATALAAGCATNPPRVEQAVAADHPADWASRMRALPVEVHGAVPGKTAALTTSAIDHGTGDSAGVEFGHSGLSLYAMPRVVVYVGGTAAPARDQYCSLEPNANRSVRAPRNALVLRAELCDGPRAVAYARISLPQINPTSETVAHGIEQLESDLVQSLPLPEPPLAPEFGN
jgi:hypothetical protein